jgi:diguanylate cyclase (GGDEF)-like protein
VQGTRRRGFARGVSAFCLLAFAVGALGYLLLVLGQASWQRPAVVTGVVLLVLMVCFQEATRVTGRARLGAAASTPPDITPGWACAAALSIPPVYALAVVVTAGVVRCLRPPAASWRPAASRRLDAVAALAVVPATAACAAVVAALRTGLRPGLSTAGGALTVLAGLAAFGAVHRLMLISGRILAPARAQDAVGTRQDNLLQVAALCLGGLSTIAPHLLPGVILLVLLPMALVQRSGLADDLATAAATDGRTGLYRATAWEHLAHRRLARAHRWHRPTTLLMIDLDHFKVINDTFGHQAGDHVLTAVGALLRNTLRRHDLPGRLGGEEFAALLPGVHADRALGIAERLRQQLAGASPTRDQRTLTGANARLTVTVSIGVATSPGDGTTLPDLLRAADTALYAAKHAGRNQVVRHYRDQIRDQPPLTLPAPHRPLIGAIHS